MTVPELVQQMEKSDFTPQELRNMTHFLGANLKKVEFYKFNDTNGDTYVLLKWPHKVPELKVLQ